MSTEANNESTGTSGPGQQLIEVAQVGDQLDEASLASLRTFLNDQLDALNEELEKATAQDVINAILAMQDRLAAKATALTGLSILLQAGEAKISAEHIKSAVDAAQRVIDKVKSVKAKLAKIGAVIDFAAALLTGNGKTIVEGAQTLKEALK